MFLSKDLSPSTAIIGENTVLVQSFYIILDSFRQKISYSTSTLPLPCSYSNSTSISYTSLNGAITSLIFFNHSHTIVVIKHITVFISVSRLVISSFLRGEFEHSDIRLRITYWIWAYSDIRLRIIYWVAPQPVW